MSRIAFLILFLIIVALDLFQVYSEGTMRWLTKPLIMISLISFYYAHFRKYKQSTTNSIFLVALVAALAGDSFLLIDEFFVYGLSSFLIMQLLYSYCFTQDFAKSKSAIAYALLVVMLICVVAYKLWPDLGSLKIPVVVYMTAIGIMTITAFSREKTLSGYRWIFIGTLLFVVSDTVLGIHQFTNDIHLGKLTVMSTYAAAQYSIVQGFIDRSLS